MYVIAHLCSWLVGIHGVRRPWSSFVSLCDWLPFDGVDPTPPRRSRAGCALGVHAVHGHVGLSTI